MRMDGSSMGQRVMHHHEPENQDEDSLMVVPSPEDKPVVAGSDPDGAVYGREERTRTEGTD